MEQLVPLFAIFFLFGAPVAAWIISRVLAHQERMAMIRQGYMPPPDLRAMRRGTWQGPVPPPPGPGMQMPPPMGGAYDPAYYAQMAMNKGIRITFVGFALLIGLSFIGMHGGTFYPGPWLLGGLVPMFVGIGQIISAVLGGARLPGMIAGNQSHQGANFGPPPGPSPGPTPPPPSSGPYAWRPGSTPEIEKPVQPPDLR